MSYASFFQMIGAGTVIMFGLMYLNTYEPDHVFFSETRAYMALIMGATMALVMLAFMWKMYPRWRRLWLGGAPLPACFCSCLNAALPWTMSFSSRHGVGQSVC